MSWRQYTEDNTPPIPRASADPGPSSRRYTAAPVTTEVEERVVERATERSLVRDRERQDNMTNYNTLMLMAPASVDPGPSFRRGVVDNTPPIPRATVDPGRSTRGRESGSTHMFAHPYPPTAQSLKRSSQVICEVEEREVESLVNKITFKGDSRKKCPVNKKRSLGSLAKEKKRKFDESFKEYLQDSESE